MDPAVQTLNQGNSSPKKYWLYIVFITLAITTGMSGYLIGAEQGKSAKSVTQTTKTPQTNAQYQKTLPKGIQKMLSDSKAYSGGLLGETRIIQTYSGKLISLTANKSWTLEDKGKRITITNESENKINYFTKQSGPKNPTVSNKAPVLKIGDELIIEVSFRQKDIKTSILKIIQVLPGTAPASTTPVPSATPETE